MLLMFFCRTYSEANNGRPIVPHNVCRTTHDNVTHTWP